MSDIERREYCLKHFLASNKAEPNIYEAFCQGWDNYKHDHGHRIKEQEAEIRVLREQLEQSTKASAAWALEAGRLEGQLRTDREAHNALVAKATAWGREAVNELEHDIDKIKKDVAVALMLWFEKWALLEDVEINRKSFPDNSWYSKNGKLPTRTCISHVGLDKLNKMILGALESSNPVNAEEGKIIGIDLAAPGTDKIVDIDPEPRRSE